MSGVPAADGGGWDVAFGSARGGVHVRDGRPREDAVAWWPGPGAAHGAAEVVVAVSDGVGSRDCFRSDRGAWVAVSVACAVGADLLRGGGLVAADPGLHGLWSDVAARWQEVVRADLESEPFTEEELAGTSGHLAERDPVLAYAATLLLVVATADRLLVGQLGDGDLLLVASDGTVRDPLPPDAESVAGVTSSLAQPDAAAVARSTVVDLAATAVDTVLVCTDGYGNAFADPQWQADVGRDVRTQLAEDGVPAVRARVGGWVQEAADVGGDDATLAVLTRIRS